MSTSNITLPSVRSDGSDSKYRVAGKYLLGSLVGLFVWLGFLVWIQEGSLSVGSESAAVDTATAFEMVFLAIVVLSVLAPAYIHKHSPSKFTDRYQALGVYLSMGFSVNVIISIAALGFSILSHFVPEAAVMGTAVDDLTIINGITVVIISSFFLPAPYLGILIGRVWSN